MTHNKKKPIKNILVHSEHQIPQKPYSSNNLSSNHNSNGTWKKIHNIYWDSVTSILKKIDIAQYMTSV